jgi:hypothetical protein
VPCEAAGEKVLLRRQIQFANDDAGNGGKSIAIKIREGSDTVTFSTSIDCLEQAYFLLPRLFQSCFPISCPSLVGP